MINKIILQKEIDKIDNNIKFYQITKNKLENYNSIIKNLQSKYKEISAYQVDKDYNLYADLTDIENKKIYFIKNTNQFYYYIKTTDKEYNVDIFDIKTINNDIIIESRTYYHYDDDDDGSYCDHESCGEYIILIKKDLVKLSNQFKDSEKVLSILKSKILELIRLKPNDCDLFFNSERCNNKIIKNIKENLIFA